jgi:uncharacterized OsmC-like protein
MGDVEDYLKVKRAALARMREQLAQPGAEPLQLSATARVAGESGVRPVQVREFTIVTDSGAGLAGYNLGPTAPELLLSALASCLAHTVMIVAATHGIAITSLELRVTGEIDFRAVLEVDTSLPTRPQNLAWEARLATPAPEQAEFLRGEVERLCPVLRAITEPVEVAGKITVL